MGKLDELPRFEAKTRKAWRTWLKANHLSSSGVWLVTFKKNSGQTPLPYAQVVEELLCFGWIDSLPRALDEKRSMLLCTPRKPKSAWSKANRERVERLVQAGLMMPRGLEFIEQAKRSGAWNELQSVEALEVPPDLVRALNSNSGATKNFQAFPPSARRGILDWIRQAKRPETRARRVQETAECAARNERANQWRG